MGQRQPKRSAKPDVSVRQMDIHKIGILDVVPQLLKGAAVTMEITLLTAVLALVLSFVIAFLRLVPNPFVRFIAGAYVEILRGTSAIVQLYYLFFILPAFGISLQPTATAVIGLGLNLSAYGSEVVRAGILAIGSGQHEGATSLGLTKVQTYRLVILPQALVLMLPSFGNLLIDLVKGTSLVSLITITELTFSGRQMIITTGYTIEVWTLVLLLYFAIAYPLSLAVRAAERYATRFRCG